jgi:hypothetical protein
VGNKTIGYININDVFEPIVDIAKVFDKINFIRCGIGGFANISAPLERRDGTKVCHLYASPQKTEQTIFAF